jgi:hypothetical protein
LPFKRDLQRYTVEGPIDDDGNALASVALKELAFNLSGLVKSAQVGEPEKPLPGAKVTAGRCTLNQVDP